MTSTLKLNAQLAFFSVPPNAGRRGRLQPDTFLRPISQGAVAHRFADPASFSGGLWTACFTARTCFGGGGRPFGAGSPWHGKLALHIHGTFPCRPPVACRWCLRVVSGHSTCHRLTNR